MEKLTITYALIRYCWNEGDDHLDCFWPFAIRAFPLNHKEVDLAYLKTKIKADFDLDIPLHSLSAVLKRAVRKELVISTKARHPLEQRYSLTEKGTSFMQSVELEKEVERRMNALLSDIRAFILSNYQDSVSEVDINACLLSLVRENLENLVEFLNTEVAGTRPTISSESFRTQRNRIAEYIKMAEKEKPEHYSTLKDIILGSVLSTAINSKGPVLLDKAKSQQFRKRFSNSKLFLDTNFILSIFGLHEKEFNTAADELLNILNSHNFKLKVFSFTIDEICRVMNWYLTEVDRYPGSISIENSIYSNLKRRGWTRNDVKEFVMQVEERLKTKNIEVENITDIDIKNYKTNESMRIALEKYKRSQPAISQNHDLAAIERIRMLRNHTVRRIENAGFLFLSSDRALSNFNLAEMGHKADSSVGEVILDSTLTNVIWLSNPTADISLKSIIASHSHGLFIKREVWLRFYEALKKIRQQEKVDDQAISTLFYDNFIEKELIPFDQSRLDEIDEAFALMEVEKAAGMAKVKQGEKEVEFVQRLTLAVSQTEQQKERQFADQLEEIRAKLRLKSKRVGRSISIVFSLIISAGLIVGIWYLNDQLKAPWVSQIILSFGGLGGVWWKFMPFCEKKIATATYSSRLKEIGLEINKIS